MGKRKKKQPDLLPEPEAPLYGQWPWRERAALPLPCGTSSFVTASAEELSNVQMRARKGEFEVEAMVRTRANAEWLLEVWKPVPGEPLPAQGQTGGPGAESAPQTTPGGEKPPSSAAPDPAGAEQVGKSCPAEPDWW